jgi:hypothetical protein
VSSFEDKEKNFQKKQEKIERNKLFLAKLYVFMGVFSFFGYVLNILRIFSTGFDEMTFLMIVRLVGIIVFPIGIFIGYY